MFNFLTQKLSQIVDKIRAKGVLTEHDVSLTLREIRMALIEADVALPAIKSFIQQIQEKAIGQNLLKSISPAQMVTKIVHEEIVALLTHPQMSFVWKKKPFFIMMVGLQGSGKTTMCAKIATLFKNKKIMMASLDVYRPAAQEQLELLGKQIGTDTLDIIPTEKPLQIAQRACSYGKEYDAIIIDTAGRMHVDSNMMEELKVLHTFINPQETIFVADALAGQSIVHTVEAFQSTVPVTGLALSRIDADARAGAALSLSYCTRKPLYFMGTGERPQDITLFDPVSIADRILDRGDMVALVQKAQQVIDKQEQEKEMERLKKGIFTLDDLLKKFHYIEKIGGIKGIMGFLPGMQTLKANMKEHMEKASLKHQKAIIMSMTPKERRNPDILNAARKKRVAHGSGRSVTEVNRLLDGFYQMQKMMKMMSKGWGRKKNT